jgi:hypothetical protein
VLPGIPLAASAAITILLWSLAATSSHAQYRARAGSSVGIRSPSEVPPAGRTRSPRATIIPNRSGGFDMYSPQGNSRYLGKAQGNKVFHPNGTGSIVVPDSNGGSTVYGPQGSQRIFPEKDPYTDE